MGPATRIEQQNAAGIASGRGHPAQHTAALLGTCALLIAVLVAPQLLIKIVVSDAATLS
jgi:hypothetical protein